MSVLRKGIVDKRSKSEIDSYYIKLGREFLKALPKTRLLDYSLAEILTSSIKNITVDEIKKLKAKFAPLQVIYFLFHSSGNIHWIGETIDFCGRFLGQHMLEKEVLGKEVWSRCAILTFPRTITKTELHYAEDFFIRLHQPKNSIRQDTGRLVTKMDNERAHQLRSAGFENTFMPLAIMDWENILPERERVKRPLPARQPREKLTVSWDFQPD